MIDEVLPIAAPLLLAELWDGPVTAPGSKDGVCIDSARIAVEVLAKVGVKAKAVATQVLAANAAAVPLLNAGVPIADWPDEAWTLGVELGPAPHPGTGKEPYRRTGWTGHVVVVGEHEKGRWMLDLTAAQFNRPSKGILIPEPIWAPLRGDDEFTIGLADGAQITYILQPKIRAFRQSNAWQSADLSSVPALAAFLQERLAG